MRVSSRFATGFLALALGCGDSQSITTDADGSQEIISDARSDSTPEPDMSVDLVDDVASDTGIDTVDDVALEVTSETREDDDAVDAVEDLTMEVADSTNDMSDDTNLDVQDLDVETVAVVCDDLVTAIGARLPELTAYESGGFRFGGLHDLGLGGPLPDAIIIRTSGVRSGTFDLATMVNATYATCEQCVEVLEDISLGAVASVRRFFQRRGTLTVASAAPPAVDLIDIELRDLELVEVTIADDLIAHEVVGGLCLTVVSMAWEALCEPSATSDSTCDGRDNDCDGQTDEDFMPVATSCGNGACAATGQTSCTAGSVSDSCAQTTAATNDQTCDGIDDDCDSATDEDYVARNTTCGVGACAQSGITSCVGGEVKDSCLPSQPGVRDATCDGVDDDCDDLTDEDYQPTTTSCGVGACAASGSTTCVGGSPVDSCQPRDPAHSDATCDRIDDDCDGLTDEDFSGSVTNCGVGPCANTGHTTCANGQVVDQCTPGTAAPSDASCNGVDEDCDGAADEDYVPVGTTCGVGACAATGATSCLGGQVFDSCAPQAPAADDTVCNGIDDDCAGGTDEDYVSLPTACGVGACAAAGSTSCVGGQVLDSCAPLPPATDDSTCNGIDDDCDNRTDEDYAPVLTQCGQGECASTGMTSCEDGDVLDDCEPLSPCHDGLLLPTDPVSVAPLLDPSVATPFGKATEFLYAGDNPIQVGVAQGAIEPVRAAVTSGRASNHDGTPAPGVTVSVLDHPEYGSTRTRLDGKFDLAVNGGGTIVVNYEASGYLPVQRRVTAEVLDYALVDDIVLTPLDTLANEVSIGAEEMQVAEGTPQTDADGTRRPVLMVPSGTHAGITTPDGTSQPLDSLTLRLTEYTVGERGVQAMPGDLPPASAYTYAVELSVDEAILAGATRVDFNQPLAFGCGSFGTTVI